MLDPVPVHRDEKVLNTVPVHREEKVLNTVPVNRDEKCFGYFNDEYLSSFQ
jgi:hypothetical protein